MQKSQKLTLKKNMLILSGFHFILFFFITKHIYSKYFLLHKTTRATATINQSSVKMEERKRHVSLRELRQNQSKDDE